MKDIVPVDFSAQSINTAVFASQMLNDVNDAELIVYHLYQQETKGALKKRKLQETKERLQTECRVNVRCLAEKGSNLIETLNKLVLREEAALIVMCVRHSKIYEDSKAVQILAQSHCPVLVIPGDCVYRKIKNVALASDFCATVEAAQLAKLKVLLKMFTPHLYIVHVSPVVDVFYSTELVSHRKGLEAMFQEYNPKFHFIPSDNFTKGLNDFIDFRNIDLVLTFPRRHNFLTARIRGTNTKKLLYRIDVPILTAHE